MDNYDDSNGFGFDEDESEFEKILRESQIKDSMYEMELKDASYQVEVLREYGLRAWFKASKFSKIEHALDILTWCMEILERPDIERYEDCILLRDSIKWLNSQPQKHNKETKDDLYEMPN